MPRRNALIASVEPEIWKAYADRFTPVTLERGDNLQRPGEAIDQVQFPTSAVIVLGVETVAGESVNVALLGSEGAVGVYEACGTRQVHYRATVQFAGQAWQTPAATYRSLYEASSALRTAIHKYVEVLMMEARQFVACNALHSVENRLARTLLDAVDKAQSADLPITQESLAQLLGVQRTTVAAVVSSLQRTGSIRSGRRGLVVVDTNRLMASACSCRASLSFARADIQSRDVSVCED